MWAFDARAWQWRELLPGDVPGIVATPIRIEDVDWADSGPLVAVSAREVWAVTGTGLIGRLEDRVWAFYRPGQGFAGGLAAAPDGTVWAATYLGVFSFDGEQWTRRLDSAAQAVDVAQDGTVWISGGWGEPPPESWLARGDGESWVRVDPTAQGGAPSGPWAAAPNGEVWIAVNGWGEDELMHCDGATCEVVQIGDYPEGFGLWVNAVWTTPNGDVWVKGNLDGFWGQYMAARFDGEVWTVDNRLAVGGGVAVGPDGVVWTAMGSGLASIDGTEWTYRITQIEGPWIYAVDVAPDGTVWYTDDAGLHTLDTP